MPGAAGIRAANYLYNVAPKDGTVIGMLDQAVSLDQILGSPGLTADATRFNWIGRLISNSAVLYAWHTARREEIEDAFTHELIVSTSGAASRLNWTVLNNVVGTKFKIITGYQGHQRQPSGDDARRGRCAQPAVVRCSRWKAEQLLRDKQINLLVQTGAQKHPELPQVPRMIDLARNADDRTLLELFSSPSTIGRSVAVPPGVPAERVAALRQAFMAAVRDPALLDEVQRLKLELEPLGGAALQDVIATGGISDALIARARSVAER